LEFGTLVDNDRPASPRGVSIVGVTLKFNDIHYFMLIISYRCSSSDYLGLTR
jgi:hypothetical protein